MDCYKKMINNMGDWKDSWTGSNAKWIDKCEATNGAGQIVTIFENDYTQAVSDVAVLGGTS